MNKTDEVIEPQEWYVRVVYPRAMRNQNDVAVKTFCSWYSKPRYAVDLDEQPHDAHGWHGATRDADYWDDTFGPFSEWENVERFVAYTQSQFDMWPDSCQGERAFIAVLDAKRQYLSGQDATIGSATTGVRAKPVPHANPVW